MSISDSIDNITGLCKNLIYSVPYLRQKSFDADADRNLIYRVQPVGGIKPHENYITLGDGYMTCIKVYAAPEQITRHWLYPLLKLKNVIITFDTKQLRTSDVKDSIKRSVNEHLSRKENANDVVELMEADTEIDKLTGLLGELNQLGNVVLGLTIRIFVVGRTFFEMEQSVLDVEQQLKSDGFSIFSRDINEQLLDFQSLLTADDDMQKTLSARKGIPVPANIMGASLPYYYVGWQDSNGFYLGDTYFSSGTGCVFFDPFYKDNYRASYDGFMFGLKGTGKSTTLKTLVEQTVATGNRVRIIDVDNGFESLVKNLGGVVVKLDGTEGEGILNPLEIFRMDENETQNYLQHISKMALLYRLKDPNCSQHDVDLFTSLLKELYVNFGILPALDASTYENITGLESDKYPIFSDLLDLVNKKIRKYSTGTTEEDKLLVKSLVSIRFVVDSIVKNFGSLFNGHTNIPKVFDSDVISFDISKVSKMDPTAYDMQLFNVLSMAYDSCMTVGTQMKWQYDNGRIDLRDVIHHLIIVDESNRSINTDKPFAVKRMKEIMKEDRKYFIGVWLATQDIADNFISSDSIAASDMQKLFSLCQYKIIFRQDPASLDIVRSSFKNVLSEPQIQCIPQLQNREMLLNLSAVQTIRLTARQVSSSKLAYYGGGA